MFRKALLTALVVLSLSNSSLLFADFLDDFSEQQKGTWAPARWGTDYASRGKCIVPPKSAVGPTIALTRGQRLQEITAAGGFVVEADVVEIKGDWAGLSIGSGDLKRASVAIVLHPDNSTAQDQVYVNGTAIDIGNCFDEGQKVRIEITTKNMTKGDDALVTVLIADKTVLSDYGFQWQESPSGCSFVTGSGRAVYDNLYIAPAEPVIEFEREFSNGSEEQGTADIKVLLKRPLADQTYSVDYKVTGGTAINNGVDYMLNDGTLVFDRGENVRTISIALNKDNQDEYDESIEITLSNPKGTNVRLGRLDKHTYVICDRWPLVSFENASSSAGEGAPPANVKVSLSHPCKDVVTVKCAVVGGTATAQKDYTINPATLTFSPGQTSQQISIDINDDTESENSIDETAVLRLVEPKNAAPGFIDSHTFNITDNEPWIEFDGSMWICGQSKHTKINGRKVLSINDRGQLEWVSTYGDILYAKLPAQSVAKVGEAAEYMWLYKGEGNGKGSYVENICERYGSGDLRLSLLDLNGKSMSLDRQYTRNDKVFCGSKGYQARLSPHVPTDQRADKWAIRVNPSGDNCHSPVDWGGCWGFEQYFNGHGVAVGEFSPMIISVARTGEDTMAFSVTLNNEKHTMIDKDKAPIASDKEKMRSQYGMGAYGTGAYGTGYGPGVHDVNIVPGYQPKKVDTMAIYFANQRPLNLITLAPIDENLRKSIAAEGSIRESFPLKD